LSLSFLTLRNDHHVDKIRYGTITIPYSVIKIRRIKTSEVIVDADNITVRAPLKKDKMEIQKIVLNKAKWILKKQKEYRDAIPEVTKPSFKEYTTLPYIGRNYPIKINKKKSENHIDLVDGRFLASMKSRRSSSNILKKLYYEWLRENAEDFFDYRIKEQSKKTGISVKRIVVKNLKNRWGSLANNGVINLNLNLIKAPEDVIDYIILHELCHQKIKEHSYHYWDMLHRFMPDYDDKIEWLKVNGRNLL
jgi:predicted metal-dependent hydrolase